MKEEKVHIEWEILRKAAIGEANSEERAQLDLWLNASEEHRAYFEKARRFYAQSSGSATLTASTYRNKLVIKHWSLRVAAAAVVGIGLYMLLSNGDNWQLALIEKSASIKSTSKHVTLTLSDGRNLDIDPAKEQLVLNEKDTVQVEHGEITYYGKEKSLQEGSCHTIEVPSGTTYKILLNDSTVVRLNAKSKLTYPIAFTSDVREVLVEGEAFFEVKKDNRPFIVRVANKQVMVLGTSFNVNAYNPREVVTSLLTGSVKVKDEFENTTIIAPGQQACCTSAGIGVQPFNEANQLAWLNNMFSFQQESLEGIMEQLMRWYDLEVEFSDESLKQLKFTGSLNKDDAVDKLMSYFEKTKRVNFVFDGNKITVNNSN
ncbi:MAG: FecR family protein [Mangrovibacterium sp.]